MLRGIRPQGGGNPMAQVDETDILSVIDAIYSAASDFALWPEALVRIADLLGALDAALGTMGPQGIAWLQAPRTDPDYLQRYPDYHAEDLVWHEVAACGVGGAVTDDMVADAALLRSNAYHHEWSLPQGYRTKLGGLILEEDGWRTVMILPGRNAYTVEQRRLFRLIAHHLRRAVQMNIRLAGGQLDGQVSTHLLERMNGGAMLIDGDCRLVFANKAAETLFLRGGGMELTDGRLRASGDRENAALEALIGRCVRRGLGDSGGELVLRTNGWEPRKLLVVPLRQSAPPMAPGLPVAILLEAADRSDEATTGHLRLRYGLTPAEAAFAVEIAKGDGKRAAAARRGIAYSTARTHLSHIFDKTGVSRQGELVRLIVGNGAPG
jgi:DNA-binding CsgD family transcriptional regulator